MLNHALKTYLITYPAKQNNHKQREGVSFRSFHNRRLPSSCQPQKGDEISVKTFVRHSVSRASRRHDRVQRISFSLQLIGSSKQTIRLQILGLDECVAVCRSICCLMAKNKPWAHKRKPLRPQQSVGWVRVCHTAPYLPFYSHNMLNTLLCAEPILIKPPISPEE